MTAIKTTSEVIVNQRHVVAIVDQQTTLSQLLEQLEQLENDSFTLGQHVAIAVNNQIVTKPQWPTLRLNRNDKINVFGAIAGG